MPSKQPPAKSTFPADASEPAAARDSSVTQLSQLPAAVAPATKRFKVAVVLFGVWLVFLIYLAFLTWTGK